MSAGATRARLNYLCTAELFFLIQLEISSARRPRMHLMFDYVDLIGRIIGPRADAPTCADVVINVCRVASIYAEAL